MARKASARAAKPSSRPGSSRGKTAGGKTSAKKGKSSGGRKATGGKQTAGGKKSAGGRKPATGKRTSAGKKIANKKSATQPKPATKKSATQPKPANKKSAAKKSAARKPATKQTAAKASAGGSAAKKRPSAKGAGKRTTLKRKAGAGSASKKPARRAATRGPVEPRSSREAPRWPTGPRPIPERELMTDDAQELNLALAEFEEGVRDVDDADVEYAAKKGPKKLAKLARDIPQPLKDLWADLKAMVTCVRDYWTGTYREIPWKSIAAMTGAIVYFVSPIDVIPDFVPLIGYVDDAAVISLALKWVSDDLAAYRRWKEGTEASGTAATE